MFDVRESIDSAVKAFKVIAGYNSDDTMKDVILGLKKKFPELQLEVQEGSKFVLTTGAEDSEEESLADTTPLEVINAFRALSDLIPAFIDLANTAVASAVALITRAKEFKQLIRDSGLKGWKIPKAIARTFHNVKEFKKVPQIVKAFKQAIGDLVEDLQNAAEDQESEEK
ncbi:uncharacterized protein [Ptychodera flava]|uniref:uncharacterized protein n=1 Tax=Ptychodera flava TaxID=63121 RepID=UPI003969C4D0